jgi:catechol 2,3-dioxygenase-like lactoylglutathione lyase family enzyme
VLEGTDHIVYYVTDVERTIAWYEELFGLNAEGIEIWRSGRKPFVSIRVSPALIIDLMPGEPNGAGVDHIAFTTGPDAFDAFAATHVDLIEMGPAQLSGARGIGEGLYLRDPDNHRIELRTYRTGTR